MVSTLWTIAMLCTGEVRAYAPGMRLPKRILYQHPNRTLIGLTIAYSTYGTRDGKRVREDSTFDKQKQRTIEVAERIIARKPEYAEAEQEPTS